MATMSENQDNSALDNAEDIIERFGGIRPMATKMGVPVTTVQGWKKRNVIPGNRRADVIEAADTHNIDIADLLAAGSANENARAGDMRSARIHTHDFGSTLTLAQKQEDAATAARHDEAIGAARVTAAHDEIIKSIRAAERRAIKTSTWVSAGLVLGVCALGAVLLWPTHNQVQDNTRRVAALEGQVGAIRDEQGTLRRLIPDDLSARFAQLQEQAAAIQTRIGQAALQAEAMATTVLGVDMGDIGTRLSALEDHIGTVAGNMTGTDLGGWIDRIKMMQQSAQGQAQLSGVVGKLNALIADMSGRVHDIDAALAAAQQQDGTLAQTFEGVSPTDLRAAAMLLGLAQFRSSLNRNEPFAEDLLLLKGLVDADDTELLAAIDRLAPRAAAGVLTPAGLSDQFKGLAGDIVVSSLKGEDVSVRERATARLNEIMQVQKDGQLVTGTDTQAKVARAQKMLDDGDIQGAIGELQGLQGPAATTAQPFMDEATATLAAEKLRALLADKVLGQLGGATGGGAPYVARSSLESLLGDLGALADTRRVIAIPDTDIKFMPPATKTIP